MVEKVSVIGATQAGNASTCPVQAKLTIRESSGRKVVFDDGVANRDEAITIYSSLGPGYDARIITPQYVEVILSRLSS